MRLIHHPLRVRDIPAPIQTVLRDLAGQEGCDGEPYDQMMEAADYIDALERELEAVREHFGWKRDGRSIAEILEARVRREVNSASEERGPSRHKEQHDHD